MSSGALWSPIQISTGEEASSQIKLCEESLECMTYVYSDCDAFVLANTCIYLFKCLSVSVVVRAFDILRLKCCGISYLHPSF